MPTIKDVSRLTGLAYATISKYLNGGNVLPQNRVKIEAAIKELNFTVNEFARGLKTNKSNTVGIIIPDIGNVYVALTIPIIVDELRKKDYATIICDSRSDHEREFELVNFLMAKRVDGIINMPIGPNGSHLYAAIESAIPIVLLDRIVSDCIGKVDTVLVDNVRAGQEVTSYLIGQGHTEIGIIAGPRDVTTAMERLSGYISILKKHGLAIKDSLIEHGDYSSENGYRACKRLLKNNPSMTALFATNYDITMGAMMAINEYGLSVPDDLSFFGFDDMPFAQVIKPHLSVIAQPIKEIGQCASRMLLERMCDKSEDPAKVTILHTNAVFRDSVGKPPAVKLVNE
jgi:LacI family transcriptional regulator